MAPPSFEPAAVRVLVPATSANLGPGFDAFGLALGLYDEVVVRAADAGLRVSVTGEGAGDLPRDERHLVVASLRAAFDLLGGQPAGLEVACTNRIPQSRGLGSSAAAIVAGVLAARALVVGGSSVCDDDAALTLAARLEGHPDNVAACLLGGLTIAWSADGRTGSSRIRAVRLEPAADLAPVVFVPVARSSTVRARAALPATVPHADAAANAGWAALLVPAMTGRLDLLFDATQDRLHQDARGLSMPETAALVHALRGRGIPAVVSGAGPAVLAFTHTDLSSYAGADWHILRLPVAAGPGATMLREHAAGGSGC